MSDQEKNDDQLDEFLECYLYGATIHDRDDARRSLAARGSSALVKRLLGLLLGPRRDARRRAAFMLLELAPALVLPPLRACLGEDHLETHSEAALIEVARLIAKFSDQEEPQLRALISHSSPRVRRAALSTATPHAALSEALVDEEVIASKAASLFLQRGTSPDPETLCQALERHPTCPELLCLSRRTGQASAALRRAVKLGDRSAIAYLSASEEPLLQELLKGEHAEEAAWRLAAESRSLAALGRAESPRLRAAAARRLPADHESLSALCQDQDPGVAWLARRNRSGAYQHTRLEAFSKPHAALTRASARPPYGIRAHDELAEVPRSKAALALCHGRFESNLGVALRSAEAAGLSEVFLLGQSKTGISAARGVDRVLSLEQLPDEEQLIATARRRGYQLVSIQQAVGSELVHQAIFPPQPLFIVGAEDRGISPTLLRASDLVVEIPLFGEIDSLNVAAAATVALFQWRFQRALSED